MFNPTFTLSHRQNPSITVWCGLGKIANGGNVLGSMSGAYLSLGCCEVPELGGERKLTGVHAGTSIASQFPNPYQSLLEFGYLFDGQFRH
jgi:hypothetical protein